MKFNLLLLVVFVLTLTSVSAWPYELYSNGTLVDLNSSNNQSVNLTIYQITQVTNITNVTEIVTEIYNVTNMNVTENYNLTTTNNTYYTKNESDALFMLSGSQYGNTEVFNRAELNVRLDNLTATDANLTTQLDKLDETPTGWIWFGILTGVLMAGIALALILKGDSY